MYPFSIGFATATCFDGLPSRFFISKTGSNFLSIVKFSWIFLHARKFMGYGNKDSWKWQMINNGQIRRSLYRRTSICNHDRPCSGWKFWKTSLGNWRSDGKINSHQSHHLLVKNDKWILKNDKPEVKNDKWRPKNDKKRSKNPSMHAPKQPYIWLHRRKNTCLLH